MFSKKMSDVRLLARIYGGNYYPHGVGYVWVTGNQDAIDRIRKETCDNEEHV